MALLFIKLPKNNTHTPKHSKSQMKTPYDTIWDKSSSKVLQYKHR